MDIIFELIVNLIFEGTVNASQNEKNPKFVRYLLIFLIVLFFIAVIGSVIGFGIYLIKDNIFAGIAVIAIGLFSAVTCILKLRNTYKKKQNN